MTTTAPALDELTITIVVDNTTDTLSTINPGIPQLPEMAYLLGGEPELIARKSRALLRYRDGHVALEIEACCRCPVEEMAGDLDCRWRLRRDAAGR